jgi:GH25 family lysozyme M1 (1,4-beta-N-acetylmuramidase)
MIVSATNGSNTAFGYFGSKKRLAVKLCKELTPSISSVSPNPVPPLNGNQTFTINGNNFQSGDTLTFVPPEGGTIASTASKLTVNSSTQITYQFNNLNDSGAWTITVNSPDNTQHSSAVGFTVSQLTPGISNISPNPVPPLNGNQPLTFVPPEGGNIASTASKLTVDSSTQITYQFNSLSDSGAWTVTVNSPDNIQHSSAANFTVSAAVPPPSINSISPTSMPALNGNQPLIIYGNNFQSAASLTFVPPEGGTIPSTASKLTVNSSTQITYQINNLSDVGFWTVQVNNPDGQSSGAAGFTVTNTTTTTTNLALGIDVSAANGTINWGAVSGAGIQFAYIKATESTSPPYTPDTQFSANTNGAIGQHIIIGAYHFATPLFSPQFYQPSYDHVDTDIQEASNFVSAAKGIIGTGFLPPSLDVEPQVVAWTLLPNGHYQASVWVDPLSGTSCSGTSWDPINHPLPSQPAMSASALAQWIQNWVSKVEQLTHTNAVPLIYCDRTYATALYPYLNGTVNLWIADYSNPAGNPNTTGWQTWTWKFH